MSAKLRLFLFPILSVTLCQAAAAQDLVGKMGAIELRAAELRPIIEGLTPEAKLQLATDPAQLDRLVKNELLRKAVLAEARQKGWDKKSELQPQLERAREQVFVTAYVKSLSKPADGYPSEDELKQFYEANKSKLSAPAQYQIAQIFLPAPEGADKAKADEAAKKINDLYGRLARPNADFARMARENSLDKGSAEKGGEVGWVSEEMMPAEIRRTVVKMNKGDTSAPVKSSAGWHLVKLLDKKPSALRPLAEVKPNLVAAMRQRRMQEQERAYLEGLASKAAPTVNQIELGKLQGEIR